MFKSEISEWRDDCSYLAALSISGVHWVMARLEAAPVDVILHGLVYALSHSHQVIVSKSKRLTDSAFMVVAGIRQKTVLMV